MDRVAFGRTCRLQCGCWLTVAAADGRIAEARCARDDWARLQVSFGVRQTAETFAVADEFPWRVTPEQRARLRRSVDVSALERLLAYLPATERPVMLLGFCSDPTPAEALDALRTSGVSDAEFDELRRFAEYTPLPPHLAHPENVPDPNWTAPAWHLIFQVQPPDDPELRVLWEAVEPRRREQPDR